MNIHENHYIFTLKIIEKYEHISVFLTLLTIRVYVCGILVCVLILLPVNIDKFLQFNQHKCIKTVIKKGKYSMIKKIFLFQLYHDFRRTENHMKVIIK